MSRRIVVDASVARSAGTTENPISISCREFLQTMLIVCHKIVLTTDIEREWRKHRSTFSVAWLAAMQSRNKVVRVTGDVDFESSLYTGIDLLDELSEEQRQAIRKDVLLLVAASAADRLIASRDDKMRALLRRLANEIKEVGKVVWVNPTDAHETPRKWLEAGARDEHPRRIGQHELDA